MNRRLKNAERPARAQTARVVVRSCRSFEKHCTIYLTESFPLKAPYARNTTLRERLRTRG
jgi:hypothetical protein